MTYSLKAHELADEFPRITDEDFDELVASIKADGVRVPIVIYNELILDGRNRYAAAEKAGLAESAVPRRLFDVDSEGSLEDFVLDTNIHRRHLTKSQIAIIVERFATLKQGRQPKGAPGAPLQEKVAEDHGISRRTIQRAANVNNSGSKELRDAVRDGKLDLKTAEKLVRDTMTDGEADHEKQERILAAVRQKQEEKPNFKASMAVRDELKRQGEGKAPKENWRADPTGERFSVVYADPPWKFENGSGLVSPERHYDTESIYNICRWEPFIGQQVSDILCPNAVLFMWTTVRDCWRPGIACAPPGFDFERFPTRYGNATDVAHAWGFPIFHCAFTWIKPRDNGSGWWARHQYELLAIFSRGTFDAPPTSVVGSDVLQGPDYPTAGHSVKPKSLYKMIENLTPGHDGRRIEFFARNSAPGWKVVGNQAPAE